MKPIFITIICILSLAVLTTEDQKALENLLHNGNNKFTANMFSEVAKSNPKQSFVISAFNIMTPLAQLGLGSVGASHDELLNAIGMPDDNVTKEVFSMVNSRIQSVKGVTLKIASKIYVAQKYQLKRDFAVITKDTFGSEIQNIDFEQSDKAANEVNNWVEEHTNNRIKDLVSPDSFSTSTRALLVSAIYFKGFWKAEFKKVLTEEMVFHVNEKSTIKVSMMYRRGDYKYTECDYLRSQIIEIPYRGDETSFIVVLPRDIEGIGEVQEKLKNPNVLDKPLSRMDETDVELYLPKFRIDTTTDLQDILKKVNVTKVFDPEKAGLDNIFIQEKHTLGKEDFYVDSAIQKAFIEVNEEGAEAAAASGKYDIVSRYLRNEAISEQKAFIEVNEEDAEAAAASGKYDINVRRNEAIPEQKAFIEVNEEGAEAAAASVFGVLGRAPSIELPPIEFKADHPFLFFLLEEGDIIFNGIFYT